MIACPGDLVERILQNFLQPHVHDVSENSPLRVAGPLARRTGQLEDVTFRHQRFESRSVSLFQSLRIVWGDLQAMHDVGGNGPAGAGGRARVAAPPAMENRHNGEAPAQLNDGAAKLDLVWGEHGQRS